VIEPIVVRMTVEPLGVHEDSTDEPCSCGSFGVLIGGAAFSVGGADPRITSVRRCASCGALRS